MKLSEAAIAEFIGIWERHYGERLSRDAAQAQATLLIRLYVDLGRELPSERSHRTTGAQHTEP